MTISHINYSYLLYSYCTHVISVHFNGIYIVSRNKYSLTWKKLYISRYKAICGRHKLGPAWFYQLMSVQLHRIQCALKKFQSILWQAWILYSVKGRSMKTLDHCDIRSVWKKRNYRFLPRLWFRMGGPSECSIICPYHCRRWVIPTIVGKGWTFFSWYWAHIVPQPWTLYYNITLHMPRVMSASLFNNRAYGYVIRISWLFQWNLIFGICKNIM